MSAVVEIAIKGRNEGEAKAVRDPHAASRSPLAMADEITPLAELLGEDVEPDDDPAMSDLAMVVNGCPRRGCSPWRPPP